MKKISLVATKHISLKSFFLPLIKTYLNNNFKLTIICNDYTELKNLLDPVYKNNINYIDLNFPTKLYRIINPFIFINTVLKINYFLKKNKHEIIHLNTPIASHFFRIANIFNNNYLIYHVHGFRFHNKGNLVKNLFNFLIEYFLSFFTNKYIAINSYDQKIISKYFKKENILISGMGLDLSLLNKFYIKKKRLSQNIRIGIIASYKKEKGYNDIIEIAKLFKTNNRINFYCYGYGDFIKYKKYIKKFNLNNLKMNPQIDNIYSEISNFDLLIHPSRREGLSVCIIESMALGIPVITTTIRGCEDLIQDKYNGRLYNPGDIKKLYNLVNDFMNNWEIYNKYSIISYQIIQKNYNSIHLSERIKNYVNEINI